MTIEHRASEQVARLVVGQPLPAAEHIEAMIAAFMPPNGNARVVAELSAQIANFAFVPTDEGSGAIHLAAQIAVYAVKLERLAVALAAEVIRTEDAEKTRASIPEGL